MPSFLFFHTNYWEFSDTVVAAVTVSKGGYPAWQSGTHGSTVGMSIFGVHLPPEVSDLVLRWWSTILWGLSFIALAVWTVKRFPKKEREQLLDAVKQLTTLDPERLAVVERTIGILRTPIYQVASDGVRNTAQTLGFNQPQAWVKLSHTLKNRPGWAENSWRHLNACHLTDVAAREQGSTMTNRDRHFAVALAYEGFVAEPRRPTLRSAAKKH